VEYDISFMNKLAEPLPEIANRIDSQVTAAIAKWDEMTDEQQGTIYELCINLLIDFRTLAREHREFKTSDIIRDLLLDANITLEDGADGTTWRRTS